MRSRIKYNYSKSITEFFGFLEQHKDYYVANKNGMVWRTKEPELQSIIAEHFSEINDLFDIMGASSDQIEKRNTDINIHASTAKEIASLGYDTIQAVTLCCGGLSALWTTFLQSLSFKDKHFPKESSPPIYIKSPYLSDCTAYGSSLQFHISHATPMYTDSAFSTLNIIIATLKRIVFPRLRQPEQDNYLIAEIHPQQILNKNVLYIGLKYLFNEIKFKLKSIIAGHTILDDTIPLAINSGNVIDSLQDNIGSKLLLRKGSLKLAYNHEETKEMIKWQQTLKSYGVECRRLEPSEASLISGINAKIQPGGSIWIIDADGYISPNIMQVLTSAIEDNLCRVMSGIITDIYYDKSRNYILGVLVTDPITNKKTFIKTTRIYTSLGIKSKYVFDKELSNHINNEDKEIPASGYSGYLLVFGNIRNPINSNNSHFTPIKTIKTAEGEYITLVKATCGGAVGSYSFCIDHAINNLFYASHIIYPDKRVEIVAAKSCSRSINGMNSEKLTELLPGFYCATGFGGKGVTDAAGYAYNYVLPEITKGLIDKKKLKRYW